MGLSNPSNLVQDLNITMEKKKNTNTSCAGNSGDNYPTPPTHNVFKNIFDFQSEWDCYLTLGWIKVHTLSQIWK